MPKQEPKQVLAVVSDLFFSVKLSEAAKRNGLALEFVKDAREVLEKAKTRPSLIVFDLNFDAVDPLGLKWEFPLWVPDDAIDPTRLAPHDLDRAVGAG